MKKSNIAVAVSRINGIEPGSICTGTASQLSDLIASGALREPTEAELALHEQHGLDALDINATVAPAAAPAATPTADTGAILEAATTEAAGITEAATTEAAGIIEAATAEAVKLTEAATTEAAGIIEAAKTEAAALVEAAKAKPAKPVKGGADSVIG